MFSGIFHENVQQYYLFRDRYSSYYCGRYMHPVLNHVWSRAGKKPPFTDGRTLGLVLYGGAMTGVRGAGACIALHELGLDHVFDHVITNSAGFCNASYLLADQVYLGTTIYFSDLIGRRFINPLRFWKIVDIDYVVDVMRHKKPLRVDAIHSSPTGLHVALYNIQKKENEFVHVQKDIDPEKYFDVMHAATALHYLHPGYTIINGVKYKDTKNSVYPRRVEKARELGCTDVVVMYNRREYWRNMYGHDTDVFEYIPKAEWKLSTLETNPVKLKFACMQMGRMVKEAFGVQEDITLSL